MSTVRDIDAVILAGGFGTRLRPVVGDCPKALVEVLGRPFLAYVLDQLEGAGVGRVVLSTGYKGQEIRAVFGETHGRLRLLYSQETAPLGTGGGLRLALPLVESGTVMVLNGDSFCGADLENFVRWHGLQRAQVTLCLAEVGDVSRFGQVRLGAQAEVVGFTEKGEEQGRGWISAGIYAVEKDLLAAIPCDTEVSLERTMFPQWIGRGLFGYRCCGAFLDIGTPEALALAGAFFQAQPRSESDPAGPTQQMSEAPSPATAVKRRTE